MSDDIEMERQALALLELVLDQPEEQRRGWLREQDTVTSGVRSRAEALLDALDRADGRISTGGAPQAAKEAIVSPERIGAYRIVELLGEGGMGAVFRAERDAGDFDHEVAIKLIRPGAMSDVLVERFGRERQILAGLVHPNIARLYDGGTAEDGGPFIVMEYVEGVPITDWAKDNSIGLDDRLAMMERVCSAVGFAHQSLIIHRDLTPSNVLVTPDGQPKLIDFGIAKPHTDEPPPADERSSLSGLSLTPGFAAPERYSGAPATTLTDIYSLGKLLDMLVDDWKSDPDIAAIIGRATAPDPEARYSTAAALADDIERCRIGYPILARSGGRGYLIGKFVRRHRRAVAAAGAVLVLLLGAFAATAYAYSRAEAARHAEATRFEQLRSLANYMLFDLNERLERVVGTTAARAALAERAQGYLTTLADSSHTDDELTLEIARGFIQLALIQGVAAHPNLGETDRAKANLDRAEGMLIALDDDTNPAVAAALARARAYRSLILLHAESKPEEALEQQRRAVRVLAAVPRDRRDWAWMDARSLVRIAQLESADSGVETARVAALADRLRGEIDQWPADRRRSYQAGLIRAIATNYQAVSHYNLGEEEGYTEALRLFEQADRQFAALGEAQPNEPIALYRRGWNAYYGYAAAASLERDDDAVRLLQQARDSAERLLTIEEHDESLVTFAERLRESQAELFAEFGRFPQAIALQRQVVEGRRARVTSARTSSSLSDLAYGYAILGSIAREAADRDLACASWRSSERLMAEVDRRGDLRGYVGEIRDGMRPNLQSCARGAPVTSFTPLT